MPQHTAPPNILLITTDQQRHDTVGLASPDFLATPHCDWLAREGATFAHAYSDCPICVPARTTIMTGKHAHTHGMAHNGTTTEHMGHDDTLPAHMRALGYQTAAIGKMHFTPQRCRHGFDEMILPDDYYREMTRSGEVQQPMRHGVGQNELYPTMATVPESRTLTSWTAERCVDYITHRHDPTRPWFLWCSFAKPHPPLDPPEPYYSMYLDADIPAPARGDWCDDANAPASIRRARQKQAYDRLSDPVIRRARAAYYGLITQIDYNMGRLFSALFSAGAYENTLIIYTSDHGEFLGDHDMGGKVAYHEPSAHVPFLMRLPRTWDGRGHGTTVDMPVTLADIMPTCVAAGGGAAPIELDGRDLCAVVQGRAAADRQHVTGMSHVLGDHPEYLGITDGHWKYIWFPEGAQEHLFHLDEDPHELRNLVGDDAHEAQRRTMQSALIDDLEARGSPHIHNGDLIKEPARTDDERDVRDFGGLGFILEHSERDVRH